MDIFVLQSWEYERNAFADGLPASELTSHSSWESAAASHGERSEGW